MNDPNPLESLLLKALNFSEEKPITLRKQPSLASVTPSKVIIGEKAIAVASIDSIRWRTSHPRKINFKIGAGGMPIFHAKSVVRELAILSGNEWYELLGSQRTSFHIGAAGSPSLDAESAQMTVDAVYGHLRLATWDKRIARYEEELRVDGRSEYDGYVLMNDGSIVKNGDRIYPTKVTWDRSRPWMLTLRGNSLFERASIDVSVDGDVFVELFGRASSGLYTRKQS